PSRKNAGRKGSPCPPGTAEGHGQTLHCPLGAAHGVSHAHDTRGESSTRQGNLGQRFSLWLCFHCSRAHAPCPVSLSSSGMLSSKIRILRKGSQSQNPFVPQDVAWRGDRRAPVGTYC